MDTREHADRSARKLGVRGEDIHRWIDRFFDAEGFDRFVREGAEAGYDPYDHRKYRHCAEALEEAYAAFEHIYTRDQIRGVFESHLRDDYRGYLPTRRDFENGTFAERFHEADEEGQPGQVFDEDELREYFDARYERFSRRHGTRGVGIGFLIRIVLPAVCVFCLFAAVVFGVVVPHFHDSILLQKRAMIRELTAVAVSEIEHFIELEEAGRLERGEAQRRAIAEVRAMRYGPERKDYFWITDLHPRMIMHPYREDLVGTDLSDYRDTEDPGGKLLFARFAEMVREDGEGTLRYRWQWKDDPSRTVDKLSYVRGVPEWGWIVGTGIYLDDVEEDIAGLLTKLRALFGYTALGLGVLLGVLVWQGVRIENRRRQAENGLREARDRYRGLVEAATEGTMLRMNGQTVYTNAALRRMLGYELDPPKTKDPLDAVDVAGLDDGTRQAVLQLRDGECPSHPLSVAIRTVTGAEREVVIHASRLFLRGRQGQVVTVRPATRSAATTTLEVQATELSPGPSPARLSEADPVVEAIAGSERVGTVIQALGELSPVVWRATEKGTSAADVRLTIGAAVDAAVRRCAEFAIAEAGPPPVPFAFLGLGSSARREMTLFSDQDNALVFANVAEDDLRNCRRYFLRVADAICTRLTQAGFPYCEGGLLASNPRWCLSLAEWQNEVDRAAKEPKPERLRHIQILLDQRCLCGDEALTRQLLDNLLATIGENPGLLIALANDALSRGLPLGPFGGIQTEKQDGAQTLDIKACLKPIEETCRVLACRNRVSVPATEDRLDELAEQGEIDDETRRTMKSAFNTLWKLRFQNQLLVQTDAPHRPGDTLDIAQLTDLARKNLRNTLGAVETFHQRLQHLARTPAP